MEDLPFIVRLIAHDEVPSLRRRGKRGGYKFLKGIPVKNKGVLALYPRKNAFLITTFLLVIVIP